MLGVGLDVSVFLQVNFIQFVYFFRHREFVFLLERFFLVALYRFSLRILGGLGANLKFKGFVFLHQEVVLVLEAHDFKFQFVQLVVVLRNMRRRGMLLFQFFG